MAARYARTAAKPKDLSNQINWEAAVGVVAQPGGTYAAVLVSRRAGEASESQWIEDLGTQHSRPWFAGVCHDVLLLKEMYDGGQLESLERPASGGRHLNFPLSSYTNQLAFWEAMEGSSFGEIAIKLRCRRDLARGLFFGDTWVEGLAERRRREQQQQKQQPAAGGSSNGLPAVPAPRRDAPAAAPAGAQPTAAAAAAAVQPEQQPRKRLKTTEGTLPPSPPPSLLARHGDGERSPGGVPLRAGGPAGKGPAAGRTVRPTSSADFTSSADSEVPMPRRRVSPPAAKAGSPAAPGKRVAGAVSRRVIHDSSSDEEGGTALASAARAGAGAGQGKAAAQPSSSENSEDYVPLSVRKPRLKVAASATSAAAAAGAAAAGGAGELPAAGGARPTQEPFLVWLKEAEFPEGSGIFPFYVKEGPVKKSYYTINKQAGDALLDAGHEGRYEGDLVLTDAANTSRSWTVHTNLKDGKQRYVTKTSAFNRDNHVQPHDVLWLKRGDNRGHLLFGFWRFGSQEAATFAAKLQGAKLQGKATGKRAHAAAPADAAPAGILSPVSARKRAAREVFEDEDE